MIFIASKNLEDRLGYFPRIRSKELLNGKELNEVSFFHFESNIDMKFMRKFFERTITPELRQSFTQDYEFVFTPTKSSAISEHRLAMKSNLNISTLVDMDSDVNNNRISRLDNIRSTKYACTLFTIQFLEQDKQLDQKSLCQFIRKLTRTNQKRAEEIISDAKKKTMEVLVKGHRGSEQLFAEAEIKNPLNDHALVDAILEVVDQSKFNKGRIGRELEKNARSDENGLLKRILFEMINDLNRER